MASPYVPQMQAIVVHALGGPEVLELRAHPIPDPGPGEAKVRVRPGKASSALAMAMGIAFVVLGVLAMLGLSALAPHLGRLAAHDLVTDALHARRGAGRDGRRVRAVAVRDSGVAAVDGLVRGGVLPGEEFARGWNRAGCFE